MAIKKIEQYLATGRRKCSIARVFLRPGSGKITVNGRAFEDYFPTDAGRIPAKFPLTVVEMTDRFRHHRAGKRRWCCRSIRGYSSGHRASVGGIQCGTPWAAEEGGLADPVMLANTSARSTAQKGARKRCSSSRSAKALLYLWAGRGFITAPRLSVCKNAFRHRHPANLA